MKRKEFIHNCSYGCLGLLFGSSLLQGCSSVKSAESVSIKGSDLLLPVSNFKKGNGNYKEVVVISESQLQFPICVFRYENGKYEAFLMRCTHQGAELQLFGDRLECPAHGSEFDNHGMVKSGPATEPLRRFSVTADNAYLKISLKKEA